MLVKKLISISLSLFLISSSTFIPAFAQMNPLNNTEKSNIDLVVRNLHSLIDYTDNLIKSTKNKKTIQELEESKKLYEKITQNIEEELQGGKIVSVPGLDDSKNKKYRHDGELGSPKAAFCGDNKAQVKDASGNWVDCPKGNMLVDKKFLDPLNGAPIDESTQDGWQKKWELAHILVHEKAHELMINEQIAEFQKQKWWHELPQSEKDKKIELAIKLATTVNKHAQVYLVQKSLLKLYGETLKDQKKHLTDEKKSLKNTAANKPRITQIDSLILEIDNKIKWLDKTWSDLERAMAKATNGSEFGFEHCGWPLDFHSGVAAISVTFPAGYERFDLSVENDNVVDLHVTQTQWYGQTIFVEPIMQTPSLYIQMPDTVFTGQFIQPETCQYLDWATSQGLIETSQNPISEGIPDWIRQNSRWWSDGIISDMEFANAIGYLVKENVIRVNIPINPDGTLSVSNNLVIPSWIKNNAKWWSDDIVSDEEFTSAIEYMINYDIISFTSFRPSTEPTDNHVFKGIKDESMHEFFNSMYEKSMWNEATITSLESIMDSSIDILDDQLELSWNEYHSTKDPKYMEDAKLLEDLLGQEESNFHKVIEAKGIAKSASSQLKEIATIYGTSLIDLEKIAEPAQKKIDKPLSISGIDDLDLKLGEIISLDSLAAIPGDNPYNLLKDGKIDSDDLKLLASLYEFLPQDPSLLSSSLSVEDRVMTILVEVMKNMDSAVSEQSQKIESLNDGSGMSGSSIDVESMRLKRLVEQRGQLFDIFRQIIEKYNENAKGSIMSIRDGTSNDIQNDIPNETDKQPQSEMTGKQVQVLVIDGKYYPISQFFDVPAHAPNCDAMHYHSEFPSVRSIDGFHISDQSKTTCGFGKVGLIPVDLVPITQEQIDSFKQEMGFEP